MKCDSIDQRYDEVCNQAPNERFCQYCGGTSGLPRSKEVAYLEKLLIKLGLDRTAKPSLLRKVVNFGWATLKHLADNFRNVSDSVYAERLKKCKGDQDGNGRCPEFMKDGSCKSCGCPVEKKAAWASEECPLKKWLRDNGNQEGCGTCDRK